jgi:hypothetical protein
MGELSERWGRHLARSAITDMIQDAMAMDRPDPEMSLDEGVTMIIGEIAKLQTMVMDLAVAVDALMESR